MDGGKLYKISSNRIVQGVSFMILYTYSLESCQCPRYCFVQPPWLSHYCSNTNFLAEILVDDV